MGAGVDVKKSWQLILREAKHFPHEPFKSIPLVRFPVLLGDGKAELCL